MNINVQEIQKVAKKNHTSEIVSTALAMRERMSHNTMIDRLKTTLKANGERIDDKEYSAFWKSLESMGIGRIVVGRGKTPTYFEWFYSLKDIAKAAIGEKVKPTQIKPKKPGKRKRLVENTTVPQTMVEKPLESNEKYIFVTLQNGSLFELKVDASMTDKDIKTITEAMQRTVKRT